MRIPIPAIVIPVVVGLLYAFVPGIKDKPWTAMRILGAVIAIAGFVMVWIARAQLGQSFSVQPRATALVTHGLYARLRNPIYVFVDVLMFGLILVFDVPLFFALLAILIVMQSIQAHRESKVLEQHFGQEYVDYRRRTWF